MEMSEGDAMQTRVIFMLQQKVKIIIDVLNERDGGSLTTPEFTRRYKLNYNSLRSAWTRKRLSVDIEEALCDVAGFDRGDKTWYDPSRTDDEDLSNRTDDCPSFRRMLRLKNNLSGSDSRRLIDDKPVLSNAHMANFSVSDAGQSSSPDTPANVLLSLSMSPTYLADGLAFGFKSVKLELIPRNDSAVRFLDRSGVGTPARLGRGTVSSKGTEHWPAFVITAADEDHVLDGEFSTTDAPLCSVLGMSVDESMTAKLLVNPYDRTLVSTDGNPLPSKNKEQVVKRLMEKRLDPESDAGDRLVIGTQKITMVRT